MTYQPNIPQASQLISDSQQDLLDNFSVIKTTFDVNHFTFNDPKTGKHKFVQFANQTVDPGTAADEVAIYSKAVAAVSQLFYQAQSSATPLQVSNVIITSGANAGTAGGTIVFFDTIFGIRIYTGVTANIASSSPAKTVIFPTPFTTLLTGIASANDPNAIAVSCNATTTQLALRPANSCVVNWFAIGRI
jgi:hypothetical protein